MTRIFVGESSENDLVRWNKIQSRYEETKILATVAREFGVTRERVRQILAKRADYVALRNVDLNQIEQHVLLFLDSLSQINSSKHTQAAYRKDLKKFTDFIRKKNPVNEPKWQEID